ncbi:glycosyltransferase family 4 protein [Parablastomonas sp. CN1-191]|uniref:glycosyltransferase family 4 protein n=1 Tax=Parablastomonas sp. CN1-191 TaxID=3400908 RepID=UPI003BF7CD6B
MQKYGGVSRYFSALAAHLPKYGISPHIITPLHQNEYLDHLSNSLVWGYRMPEFRGARRLATGIGDILAPALANLSRARVVHETWYSQQRYAPRRARIAITVHDLIPHLFPSPNGDHRTRDAMDVAIERADHIFCVSNNTRADLISLFPDTEQRSSVTHLGYESHRKPIEVTRFDTDRPYLLHVGRRPAYKNFMALLEGFAMSALVNDFDIVCIGGGSFSEDENAAIVRLKISGKVRQVQARDDQLFQWYAGAAVFVYPSLYEGFGIPPLEAMAAGCPVVAVAAGSVPEVCGAAAQYAPDGSPEALAEAIEAVAFDPVRRRALIGAGSAQVRLFSWDTNAALTAEGYKALL